MTSSPAVASDATAALSWVAVVPVKQLDRAKTRLDTGIDGGRPALARAFATDTVVALQPVREVRAVVVVSGDAEVGRTVRALGVDRARRAGSRRPQRRGAAGIAWARDPAPGRRRRRGVRRPAGTAGARTCRRCSPVRAPHPRSVVPDGEGTGTTVLTALPGVTAAPAVRAGLAAPAPRGGAVVVSAAETWSGPHAMSTPPVSWPRRSARRRSGDGTGPGRPDTGPDAARARTVRRCRPSRSWCGQRFLAADFLAVLFLAVDFLAVDFLARLAVGWTSSPSTLRRRLPGGPVAFLAVFFAAVVPWPAPSSPSTSWPSTSSPRSSWPATSSSAFLAVALLAVDFLAVAFLAVFLAAFLADFLAAAVFFAGRGRGRGLGRRLLGLATVAGAPWAASSRRRRRPSAPHRRGTSEPRLLRPHPSRRCEGYAPCAPDGPSSRMRRTP